MRTSLRIIVQFLVVLACCAAFVAYVGDSDAWLILFYPMVLALPGAIGSALILAPLERWLERRAQGGLILLAGPVAGAVAPWLLYFWAGNTANFMAAAPILSAVGAVWGLLWAFTRPLARTRSGPETI